MKTKVLISCAVTRASWNFSHHCIHHIIVITIREDYIAEVERQLNDQTYYEKLHENPHEKFKKEIQDTLSEIQNIQILQGFENVSIPNENKVPQFYVLPKTHNPSLPLSYPGRPIVSA